MSTFLHELVLDTLYFVVGYVEVSTAADRQRLIEGFLHRGVRAGYRREDEHTTAQLVEGSDDQLFHRIRYNSGHVLHPLLPNRRSDSYNLRDRRHSFVLSCRQNSVSDCNFFTRQLFKDSY